MHLGAKARSHRGQGSPQDEAEQLFTPFDRSARTASRAPGIGIGLAVSKRLIEAQRGRMGARPRPGGGADIGFALPADEEQYPGA